MKRSFLILVFLLSYPVFSDTNSAQLFITSLKIIDHNDESKQVNVSYWNTIFINNAFASDQKCLIAGYTGMKDLQTGKCKPSQNSKFNEDAKTCESNPGTIPCNQQLFGFSFCVKIPEKNHRWTNACSEHFLSMFGIKKNLDSTFTQIELEQIQQTLAEYDVDIQSLANQASIICSSISKSNRADINDCATLHAILSKDKKQIDLISQSKCKMNTKPQIDNTLKRTVAAVESNFKLDIKNQIQKLIDDTYNIDIAKTLDQFKRGDSTKHKIGNCEAQFHYNADACELSGRYCVEFKIKPNQSVQKTYNTFYKVFDNNGMQIYPNRSQLLVDLFGSQSSQKDRVLNSLSNKVISNCFKSN